MAGLQTLLIVTLVLIAVVIQTPDAGEAGKQRSRHQSVGKYSQSGSAMDSCGFGLALALSWASATTSKWVIPCKN